MSPGRRASDACVRVLAVALCAAVGLCAAACSRPPDKAALKDKLASEVAADRDAAAKELQKIYAKDPKALGDHGKEHWAAKLKTVQGKRLPDALTVLDEPKSMGGEGGGGASTTTYRLDDYWLTSMWVDDRKNEVLGVDPPRRKVVHVDVRPPPGFTGTWTTYFVNGAVHAAVELDHGKRVREREYHDDGKVRVEYRFVDGLRDGSFVVFFADGTKEWEESYAKGKRHGPERWYWPNGKLRQEEHFADDKRDGRTTMYAEDGSRTTCIDYKADVEVGRGCGSALP